MNKKTSNSSKSGRYTETEAGLFSPHRVESFSWVHLIHSTRMEQQQLKKEDFPRGNGLGQYRVPDRVKLPNLC